MANLEKESMKIIKTCTLIAVITLASCDRSAMYERDTTGLTEEQKVLLVEQDWINAEVRHDEAELNRVIDDQFIVNSGSSKPATKADVIASVLQWNMIAQTLTNQTVLVDGDTAIVMGTAHFTTAVEGKENGESAAHYTTTYIKRDGQWRALALQMNGVEPKRELPMTNDELTEFAAQYTAAWNSQNAASVAAFFAEDGTLSVNGDPSVGRTAITSVAQSFMTAFPDMELFMDDLDIQSDQAVYHWTFVGTNTGPDGTGNSVRFSGYEEWTFGDDGLVATSMGHFDANEYQHQLEHGVEAGRSN